MPIPYVKPQIEGPALEQLEDELAAYMKGLTSVNQFLYKQVQAANPTPDEPPSIRDHLSQVEDWVYARIFKQKWTQPKVKGPYKIPCWGKGEATIQIKIIISLVLLSIFQWHFRGAKQVSR